METTYTFDDLINVGKTIILKTKKATNKNSLIVKSVYEKYDIVFLKSELIKMFAKYKSNCYSYKSAYNPQKTYRYSQITVSKNTISNPVLETIEKLQDAQIYASDFYNSLIILSEKLMYRESLYLANAFLEQESEETIAETIGISKTALQKYKKSCIIKMWIELKCYYENQ